MRTPEKFDQIVENLQEHFFPGKKPYRARRVRWILRRFFMYAYLAAMHGYPVRMRGWGLLLMKYKIWDYIPWKHRRRFNFSSKAFGYEFFFEFSGKTTERYGYKFYAAPEPKRKLLELIETDKVYDLIKEK